MKHSSNVVLSLCGVLAMGCAVGCESATPAAPAPGPSPDAKGQAVTDPKPTDPVPAAQPSGEAAEVGLAFLEDLSKGRTQEAAARFDEAMTKAMTPAQLGQTWADLIAQYGPFAGFGEPKVGQQQGYEVAFVDVTFERSALTAKVVIGADGRVTGLWFGSPRAASPSADSDVPDGVKSVAVTVGGPEWALPGIVSMPDKPGTFPGVVLVHGSGPQDRDETIGPNKPFKELAHGLAQRGLVVLRYDKRTRVHAEALASNLEFTVDDETVDDAVAAVRALTRRPEVKSGAVFVAGHSLGGMLIPRIAKRDPTLAGFVVLAGTTRRVEDVLIDQLEYVSSLPNSPVDAATLEKMKADAQAVRQLAPGPGLDKKQMYFGIPVTYWLDLKAYDVVAEAKKIQKPFLVLQGGRDYQVTGADLSGWKKAFEGRNDVMFKEYPNLNHLFLEGTGKAVPEEYGRPGHIPTYVLDDIGAFVRNTARKATRGK